MQKEIQLTDKTVLVVWLPSGVYDVRFKTMPDESKEFCGSIKDNLGNLGTCYINGIQQGYELLGIYPELTEDQVISLVDSLPSCFSHKSRDYKDYRKDFHVAKSQYTFTTALQSFQSLMERENITGYDKYAILIKSK